MNRSFFLVGIFLVLFSSCGKQKVNLESLLNEMTNREQITRFPENNYSLKQFSSYDRKTVSPNNNDWWANADYTQFIREEQHDGRREFVLFDAEGPGAVVRFWMTFAGEGATDQTLRIYLDGNEKPEIEGNVLDILSGNKLTVEPLASSVSPETEYKYRGHNLYLPIPYAQHCKITYECDAVKLVDGDWEPSIYYNIGYRNYDKDVVVESFSLQQLSQLQRLIDKTARLLLHDLPKVASMQSAIKVLQEGESLSIKTDEVSQSISKIQLTLKSENMPQALRSTVLKISFDGVETVWVPVGEFFGTGYQISPSKTWYSKVNKDGSMESYWRMPFRKNADIQLVNYGKDSVHAYLQVTFQEYLWDNNSMYFGASWHEYNRIFTAKDSLLDKHEWHFDINYVDLDGKGVYVGDALTVFNTADAWWGEGDEKIFVDGEDFPSSIGTGTEDYYGYAWCRPQKFTHPFIAQPTGAGNFHPGMTVNMRYRSLDAIPFHQQIKSDIELWHWAKTRINMALTSYWYAMPGFKTNVLPDIESVQIPVVTKRSDIYPPIPDKTGKLEGELLEVVSLDSGSAINQIGKLGWSGDSQLWWRKAGIGDKLTTQFIMNESGKYKITCRLTRADDYGIVKLYINDRPVSKRINCYGNNGVETFDVNLGIQQLHQGKNTLTIKIVDADSRAKPGNMAGIDWVWLVKEK